jgi:hypothetical protein
MGKNDVELEEAVVKMGDHWLPIEYRMYRGRPLVMSLGDVDREEVAGAGGSTKRHLAAGATSGDLAKGVEAFLAQVPPHRKIVVLVPERGIPAERWRSRQILRKDLTSKHFKDELTDETKFSGA